jgi:hypothetical protein
LRWCWGSCSAGFLFCYVSQIVCDHGFFKATRCICKKSIQECAVSTSIDCSSTSLYSLRCKSIQTSNHTSKDLTITHPSPSLNQTQSQRPKKKGYPQKERQEQQNIHPTNHPTAKTPPTKTPNQVTASAQHSHSPTHQDPPASPSSSNTCPCRKQHAHTYYHQHTVGYSPSECPDK